MSSNLFILLDFLYKFSARHFCILLIINNLYGINKKYESLD